MCLRGGLWLPFAAQFRSSWSESRDGPWGQRWLSAAVRRDAARKQLLQQVREASEEVHVRPQVSYLTQERPQGEGVVGEAAL